MPRAARFALALAVLAVSVAWVWRFQLANGFTRTFGDRYDAQIEVALLQHWANVLAGTEAWNRVAWFHPVPDTLGYNDAYLVSGLLYTAGRMLGLSPFAATDLAHVALKASGFVGMTLLLRHVGDVRRGWALFGAALFTVADLTIAHANHGQLFTLGFAPWAALAAWSAAQAIAAGDHRRVLRHGLAFAVVFGLWISTAYYLAWFFALYLLVLAALALPSGALRPALRASKPLLLVMCGAAVLLAPFLLTYLPKVQETGMHAPEIALSTALGSTSLVNTGPHNLVWGWLPDAVRNRFMPELPRQPDALFGMPPLFLLLGIVAVIRLRRIDPHWFGLPGLALLVCWGLMLDLGFVVPWRVVQALVPGAGGIRVIGRFALLLLLPATVFITILLDRMRRRAVATVLAVALLAEQVATAAPLSLDTAERITALAAVPPPPPACRVFAVVQATPPARIDPDNDPIYNGNVDAMLLASLWAHPTINGVSTFNPPGWNFARTTDADYPARVRTYAQAHGMRDICVLDIRRATAWTTLR